MSPLVIVLIVLGVVLVLGGGACVVLGGLVWIGVNAEPDAVTDAGAAPVVTGTTAPTGTSTDDDDDDTPSTPGSAAAGSSSSSSSGAAAGSTGSSGTAKSGASSGGGTRWMCNATGWVRVCGFANVCNNQMVFGTGVGTDQFTASQMAKNACQGMAIAKGGSTVCTVACTPKAH